MSYVKAVQPHFLWPRAGAGEVFFDNRLATLSCGHPASKPASHHTDSVTQQTGTRDSVNFLDQTGLGAWTKTWTRISGVFGGPGEAAVGFGSEQRRIGVARNRRRWSRRIAWSR